MSPRTVVFVVGPSRLRAFGVSTPCIFRILLSSADSLRMSPRTFGVSTPCIFRILLSSADSLRMSPRIRRISVVLSEPRVSVVRSAGIPENRSHRSIPTVFTAPLRAPGPLPPGPFGAFRLLSGHSGSFFPALCGGTVSVSLRDGCAVFPSSVCSDAEYSAIPSSFLLSGSKPACPGFLRILS
mgnify:CR=1 FL=1